MKTSIKKTLTLLLLATLWTVIIALLDLVKIGGGSITYFFAMAVFGYTSGCVVVKLTGKIFEKIESRKEAKKEAEEEEKLREELNSLNPGDILFLLGFNDVYEYIIVKKTYGPYLTFSIRPVDGRKFSGVWDFEIHNYKKTFFPTREEAEAVLAKRGKLTVASKQYHCKDCDKDYTYTNFDVHPKCCSFCGGELIETTEAGKILLSLFYSVEHEKAEEYPIKSEKLCSECKYCWGNRGCDIDRWFSDEMNRRCLTIKNGDPCPYFKKFEPKAGAEK